MRKCDDLYGVIWCAVIYYVLMIGTDLPSAENLATASVKVKKFPVDFDI